jgi:hypothetical protein
MLVDPNPDAGNTGPDGLSKLPISPSGLNFIFPRHRTESLNPAVHHDTNAHGDGTAMQILGDKACIDSYYEQ